MCAPTKRDNDDVNAACVVQAMQDNGKNKRSKCVCNDWWTPTTDDRGNSKVARPEDGFVNAKSRRVAGASRARRGRVAGASWAPRGYLRSHPTPQGDRKEL